MHMISPPPPLQARHPQPHPGRNSYRWVRNYFKPQSAEEPVFVQTSKGRRSVIIDAFFLGGWGANHWWIPLLTQQRQPPASFSPQTSVSSFFNFSSRHLWITSISCLRDPSRRCSWWLFLSPPSPGCVRYSLPPLSFIAWVFYSGGEKESEPVNNTVAPDRYVRVCMCVCTRKCVLDFK